ncbi:hypothetical protein INT47_004846 [Mucor saturninus]|uniref:LAGLIDADG endonuclease n=1 Tax=Mucor saturninus TaxID=64648 RepID=A0A8H7UVN0_9FUNG|nr:hypothetical protein INT47_004846 [Mucor saturninus]
MVSIFWKLYVLPWGQMSLWGATVITNLLSAIPWIGKDLVEFEPLENGSIYSNIVELSILPVIGTVNSKAMNKIKLRTEKEKLEARPGDPSPGWAPGRPARPEALKISKSFLAMLVGLIDGDGYIAITKTPKDYIRIDLVISLDLRDRRPRSGRGSSGPLRGPSDLDLLNYIHSVLKVGRINKYPKSNLVKLTIPRTDLQTILFPLFIYYNLYFLTETRRAQYDKVLFILQSNLKKYSELPKEFPVYNNLPVTASGYSELDFFKNWTVGFTMASGSFFMKNNKDICFSLKQRTHELLFEAFRIIFDTKVKINNFDGYSQFMVSSIKDLQTVVNFFSFSDLHPLVGYKLTQYEVWLNQIQEHPRYKNINLP